MHVSKPVVAATVAEGEGLVVDPELMETRRVNIMNVGPTLDDRVSKVVGLSIGSAAMVSDCRNLLDPATSSPRIAPGWRGGSGRRCPRRSVPHPVPAPAIRVHLGRR